MRTLSSKVMVSSWLRMLWQRVTCFTSFLGYISVKSNNFTFLNE
jgi:hypothetical protein